MFPCSTTFLLQHAHNYQQLAILSEITLKQLTTEVMLITVTVWYWQSKSCTKYNGDHLKHINCHGDPHDLDIGIDLTQFQPYSSLGTAFMSLPVAAHYRHADVAVYSLVLHKATSIHSYSAHSQSTSYLNVHMEYHYCHPMWLCCHKEDFL